MKNKILNNFIISYFCSLGTFILMNYFNLVDIRIMDTVVMAFVITFCVTLFTLDKKIKENKDLTVSNYWNLKDELKKKLNGKRQHPKKPNNK